MCVRVKETTPLEEARRGREASESAVEALKLELALVAENGVGGDAEL